MAFQKSPCRSIEIRVNKYWFRRIRNWHFWSVILGACLTFGDLVDALSRNRLLYRFCRRYVDHWRLDNNGDMSKNWEFRWLSETVPKSLTIFGVGTNIGDWTDAALKLNPCLEAHLFEQYQETFDAQPGANLRGAKMCI